MFGKELIAKPFIMRHLWQGTLNDGQLKEQDYENRCIIITIIIQASNT